MTQQSQVSKMSGRSPRDAGGSPPLRRGRVVPAAVLMLVTLLTALAIGYLLGRAGGVSLQHAREVGRRTGSALGARDGGQRGYETSYRQGYHTGYRVAYRSAYHQAYKEASR